MAIPRCIMSVQRLPVVSTVNQTLGQFRGESVQIVSGTLQSIADMAEEVTFVFSERKELSLDKRKLSDSQARVSDVEEQVNQYLSKVPELEQNRM